MSQWENSGGGWAQNTRSVGAPVLLPRQATYNAGDFEVRDGALFLTVPQDWGPSALLTPGAPGAGRDTLNSARVDSLQVSNGELQLTTDTTSTAWNASTQTAAGVALERGFCLDCEHRHVIVGKVDLNTSASGEYISLIAYQRDDLGDFIRAGVEDDGAGGYDFLGQVPGSAAVRQTASGDTIWVALDLSVNAQTNAPSISAWFNDSSSATVPTSGWSREVNDTAILTTNDDILMGVIVQSQGAAVNGRCAHFAWYRAARALVTELDEWPLGVMQKVVTWGASQFASDGPVASWQRTLPASAVISDANLQAALQNAALYDASRLTVRARRGAAPTGSYAALDAVTFESGPGGDLYLDLKMTSDGKVPCAINPVSIPLG